MKHSLEDLDDAVRPILGRTYVVHGATPYLNSFASIVHHSSDMYRHEYINTIVTLHWN